MVVILLKSRHPVRSVELLRGLKESPGDGQKKNTWRASLSSTHYFVTKRGGEGRAPIDALFLGSSSPMAANKSGDRSTVPGLKEKKALRAC